jgi:hypothetical protein
VYLFGHERIAPVRHDITTLIGWIVRYGLVSVGCFEGDQVLLPSLVSTVGGSDRAVRSIECGERLNTPAHAFIHAFIRPLLAAW